MPRSPDLAQPPTELARRFVLVERVHVGRDADVYRAEDRARRGGVAAVKVLRSDDDVARHRFATEAHTLARFDHPNVVALLHDASDDDALRWVATDWARGGSLADRVRHGAIDAATAVAVGRGALDALGAVHDLGILHRAVGPASLLFGRWGATVLCGFSAARHDVTDARGARVTRVTRVHHVLGDEDFVAPEQLDDPRDATPVSDLYALGATLFWATTGRSPLTLLDGATREVALAGLAPGIREAIDALTRAEPKARTPDARAAQAVFARAERAVPPSEA